MTDNESTLYTNFAIAISIVTVIVAAIIWFIFIVQGNVEATRLKHSTCTVETLYQNDGITVRKVTAYCGAITDA